MYQVQEEVLPRPKNEKAASTGAPIRFDLVEKPFSFSVTRKDNNEILFDTSGSSFIYESQYIRLRTKLPQYPNLYGLGEHSDPFRLPRKGYKRTFWNDGGGFLPANSNLYGSHPVYFDHRGSKGTHGVFLLNANDMDVDIDSDEQGGYLEYNMIGGVIDLYFLAGKKPADVSKQYADTVGHSAMYPYWTLGFHQCKYGYWDVNMVAEVVGNYSKAAIPLEVMWTDIDYMNKRRDFTLDPERFPLTKMRDLVTTLHERDQRYVLILDPAIPATLKAAEYGAYARGHDMDIFLQADDGSDYLGVQWAGVQVWPDWFHPKAEEWWTNEFKEFFNADTGVDIDGIWVDMNEAASFCPDFQCDPIQHAKDSGIPPEPKFAPRPNTGRPIEGFPPSFQPKSSTVKARQADSECPRKAEFNQMKGTIARNVLEPKYKIRTHLSHLSDYTIYTNITNCDGTQQYDTHNLYGHMMAHTTHTSMIKRRPKVRPFVLTRSTFAGSGREVAHWFGDNDSNWEHYRATIRQMLAFVSMHQMPMVGSDVCGFNGNAEEKMCARWALLGAFQPFYRNHAGDTSIQQEFYIWPLVTEAAKKAIDTRYKLLDYAYTALYYQSKEGTPMINPLFFLYPEDGDTFNIQEQWFYGDALLISPVTTENSDTVTFYLPNDVFYDYWTHEVVQGRGANVTRSGVKFTEIPVHIRGGTIIAERARSAMTTTALRKEPFVLIVAPGADGKAKGRLYLDDGESIEQDAISEMEFVFDGKALSVTGTFQYTGADPANRFRLDKVVLLGQKNAGTAGEWYSEKMEIVLEGPGELTGPWEVTV
jgi:alpha-glucosidase